MKEIIYQVKVNDNGTFWELNGKYHREDGPAYEGAGGYKAWYLNDKPLTEKEFNKRMNPPKPTCEGKIVEIEGVKYTLTATD